MPNPNRITVSFPGGKRVDAESSGFTIHTDQGPAHGGAGSAPEPFTLFLSSLATCAGAYVQGFCQNRRIPTSDIQLVQHHELDPQTRRLTHVSIEVLVPPGFPERYLPALERVASKCAVKRVLADPPTLAITARGASPLDAAA